MWKSPTQFCPVPTEQQPVNEYEQLKNAGLFHWPTLDLPIYRKKLTWVWIGAAIIVSPIAAASFPIGVSPLPFGLSCSVGATLIVMLLLARMLLGWYYIRDRLNAEKIFYEESGWYDGQTWEKPPEVLTRDRLIVSYQIDPILKRLQRTALVLSTILLGSGLSWIIL
ncbi:MAG: CGLD27 family protein [Microcystaceae cyanobacterium]